MLVLNCVLFLLVSMGLPILIGNELLGLTKQKITIAKSFVFGLITMWAICQIISIPLIFLKSSFILLVFLLSIIYGTLTIAGLYKKRWLDFKLPRLVDNNKAIGEACLEKYGFEYIGVVDAFLVYGKCR